MELALDWKTIFFRRDQGAAAFFRRVLPLAPAGTTYFDTPIDIAIPVGTTTGALVLYFTITAACFDIDRKGSNLDPTSSAIHLYYAELEHNTITGSESRLALDLGCFASGPRLRRQNRCNTRHATEAPDSDWVHVSPPNAATTNCPTVVSQPRDYSCEIAWSFSPPNGSIATETLAKSVLGSPQPSTWPHDEVSHAVWKRCQVLCKKSGRIFLDITYRITFIADVASLPRSVPTVSLRENARNSPNGAITAMEKDNPALGSETPSELTSDNCSQFSSLTSSQCPSSLATSSITPKRPKGWLRRTKSVVFNQLLTKLSGPSAEVYITPTKLPSIPISAANDSERNPATGPAPLNAMQLLPGALSDETSPRAKETYSEHDVHSTAFGTEVRRDYWRQASQASLGTGLLSDELAMSDLESDLEQSHEWEKVTPPATQMAATIESTGQGYYRMVIPPLPFDASPGQLATSSVPRKDLFNKLGHWLYNTSPVQYFKRADLKKRLRCEFSCKDPIYLLGTRYDLHQTHTGLLDYAGNSVPNVSRTSSVGRDAQPRSTMPRPESTAMPSKRDGSARRHRRASFNVLQFLKPAKTPPPTPPIPATPLRMTSVPPSPLATLTSRPSWAKIAQSNPDDTTDRQADTDQPTGRRRSSTWSWAIPRKSTPSPQALYGSPAQGAHGVPKLPTTVQINPGGHPRSVGKSATSLSQISPSIGSFESGQAWTAPSGLPRRTRGKRLTILTSMLSPKSPTPTHSLRSAPLLEPKPTGASGHTWDPMMLHQSPGPHNEADQPLREARRPPLMPSGSHCPAAATSAAPAMVVSPLQRPVPSVSLGSVFSPVDSKSIPFPRNHQLPSHVHPNPDEPSHTTVPFPVLTRKNARAIVDSLTHLDTLDPAPRGFPIQLAHGWYHPLPPELASMWSDASPPAVSKVATQRLAQGAAIPAWLVQEQALFFQRHGFDVGTMNSSTVVARQHGNWSSFPWRTNVSLKHDQDTYCLPLATFSLVVKVFITLSQPLSDEERYYRCDAYLGQTSKHPPDFSSATPSPAGSTVSTSQGISLYAECYGVVKVRCHPTRTTPETDTALTLHLVQAFEQTMRALRIDWEHQLVKRFQPASQAPSFACRELYHRQSVNFGTLKVPLNQPAFASSLAPALAQAISSDILALNALEAHSPEPQRGLPSWGQESPTPAVAAAPTSWQKPGQAAARGRKPSPVPSHLGIGRPAVRAGQEPVNATHLLTDSNAIDAAEPRRWEPNSTHQLSLPTVTSLFAANFGLRTLVSLQDTVSMMGLSRAPLSPMTPLPVVCQTPSPLTNKAPRFTMKRTWSDQFSPLRLRGKASPSPATLSNQSTPTPLPWTICEPPGRLDQLPYGFEDFDLTSERSVLASDGALPMVTQSKYPPSQLGSDSESQRSSPPSSHTSRERTFSPSADSAEDAQTNVLTVQALRPGHLQTPGLRTLDAFISHFAALFYFTYQTSFAAIPTAPAHVQDYVVALRAKASFATTSSSRTDQESSSSAGPAGKLPAIVGAGHDPVQVPGEIPEGHFMSSYTSDSGWGCMHRTSQMILANGFAHIMLGSGWRTRPSWQLAAEQVAAYLSIASWFSSDYQPTSHYAIQRMCLEGVQPPFEVPIGGWFGPSVAAHVLKRLALAHGQCPAHVEVCPDQMVIPEKVLGMLPTLPNQLTPDCKPVLLLLPVRLGVDRLNPLYHDNLRHLFTMPQFVGIAGGQPSKSLFFVGCQGSDLLYFDPHIPQPYHPVTVNSNTASGIVPLPHLHTRDVRACAIDELDPSMLLGFAFNTAADFCTWWHGELGAWPNPKVALFSVATPRHDVHRSKAKAPAPQPVLSKPPTDPGHRDHSPAFSNESTWPHGRTPEPSLSAQRRSRRLPRSPSESYLKVTSQMQGLSAARAHSQRARQTSVVPLSQLPIPCPQRLDSALEFTTPDSLVSPLARKAPRPLNHQPRSDAAAMPLDSHSPATALPPSRASNVKMKKRAHRQSMPPHLSHSHVRQLTTE